MDDKCALRRFFSDGSSTYGIDQHPEDWVGGLSPEAGNERKEDFGMKYELASVDSYVMEDSDKSPLLRSFSGAMTDNLSLPSCGLSRDISDNFVLRAWTQDFEPENVVKQGSRDHLRDTDVVEVDVPANHLVGRGSIGVLKRERDEDTCRAPTTSSGRTKRRRQDPIEKPESVEDQSESPKPMENGLRPVEDMKSEGNGTFLDPETEPEVELYQEFLKPNGKLSLDPLRFRLVLSENLSRQLDPHHLRKQCQAKLIKWCKEDEVEYVTDSKKVVKFRPKIEEIKLERESTRTCLLVTIRRKGPVSDPSQSLPLSSSHGKFPFHFQFEFWIGGSLIETVRSRAVTIFSKQKRH